MSKIWILALCASIALLSALISTLLGLLAAIGLNRMKRKSTRTVIMSALNIPMLNAEIVTGISLMLVFIAFGQFLNHWGYTIAFGFGTVLIGHITFNLPYTVLSILPPLSKVNVSTYEAALDLGCSSRQAFFRIVFPDILPGILSGFLLAFTLSLDDFVIIKPEMYALSTLLFVSVLALLLIFGRSRNEHKAASEKPVA